MKFNDLKKLQYLISSFSTFIYLLLFKNKVPYYNKKLNLRIKNTNNFYWYIYYHLKIKCFIKYIISINVLELSKSLKILKAQVNSHLVILWTFKKYFSTNHKKSKIEIVSAFNKYKLSIASAWKKLDCTMILHYKLSKWLLICIIVTSAGTFNF